MGPKGIRGVKTYTLILVHQDTDLSATSVHLILEPCSPTSGDRKPSKVNPPIE